MKRFFDRVRPRKAAARTEYPIARTSDFFNFPFDLDRWLETVERDLWGSFAFPMPSARWRESGKGYELRIDVPEGFSRSDLRVTVRDGTVRVEGTHVEKPGFFARVFRRRKEGGRQSTFSFAATLPPEADPAAVQARWRRGELVIEIPKEERARARVIEVH